MRVLQGMSGDSIKAELMKIEEKADHDTLNFLLGILLKPWGFFKAWVEILWKQSWWKLKRKLNMTLWLPILMKTLKSRTMELCLKDKKETDGHDKLKKSRLAHKYFVCGFCDEKLNHLTHLYKHTETLKEPKDYSYHVCGTGPTC